LEEEEEEDFVSSSDTGSFLSSLLRRNPDSFLLFYIKFYIFSFQLLRLNGLYIIIPIKRIIKGTLYRVILN
jgi:hypothetical protein